ncbi:MAG: hypothetical protein ACYSXF_08100 [Planctomycetota bacterium]
MNALALVILGGCASTYDQRYLYEPRLVDVEAPVPGQADATPVRTLVTVAGVRRADSQADLPASVEIRLRIENAGPAAVSFDPETLALFSADFTQFPAPITRPAERVEIPPGQAATIEVFFPFPDGRYPGDLDLGGLNLRWALLIDGQPVSCSTTFNRRRYLYPRFGWGIGYHRHWR